MVHIILNTFPLWVINGQAKHVWCMHSIHRGARIVNREKSLITPYSLLSWQCLGAHQRGCKMDVGSSISTYSKAYLKKIPVRLKEELANMNDWLNPLCARLSTIWSCCSAEKWSQEAQKWANVRKWNMEIRWMPVSFFLVQEKVAWMGNLILTFLGPHFWNAWSAAVIF